MHIGRLHTHVVCYVSIISLISIPVIFSSLSLRLNYSDVATLLEMVYRIMDDRGPYMAVCQVGEV